MSEEPLPMPTPEDLAETKAEWKRKERELHDRKTKLLLEFDELIMGEGDV